MNEAGSFVMCSALRDEEFSSVASGGVVGSRELVHKSMLVVDASAPVAVHIPKRFRFANARVAVAFNVLDEQVDPLEDFLVLQLPSSIFIPCARSEVDIHGRDPVQASINSCRFASPRSNDSIDSRRTR